ncbi:hypothetical protein B0H16DRAFT_1730685 [Mycena metata]|uniref:Uncharacterized protein n=1 Tax=Mycena metata TaxID=1033252 RepID=A0AAD7MXQ1_9AGAR|nr:hypothetical protein B0H16DRAFT_1730685 [Mycena metata]
MIAEIKVPAHIAALPPAPADFKPCRLWENFGDNFDNHKAFSRKKNRTYWVLFSELREAVYTRKADCVGHVPRDDKADDVVGSFECWADVLRTFAAFCFHEHNKCRDHPDTCSTEPCPDHIPAREIPADPPGERRVKVEVREGRVKPERSTPKLEGTPATRTSRSTRVSRQVPPSPAESESEDDSDVLEPGGVPLYDPDTPPPRRKHPASGMDEAEGEGAARGHSRRPASRDLSQAGTAGGASRANTAAASRAGTAAEGSASRGSAAPGSRAAPSVAAPSRAGPQSPPRAAPPSRAAAPSSRAAPPSRAARSWPPRGVGPSRSALALAAPSRVTAARVASPPTSVTVSSASSLSASTSAASSVKGKGRVMEGPQVGSGSSASQALQRAPTVGPSSTAAAGSARTGSRRGGVRREDPFYISAGGQILHDEEDAFKAMEAGPLKVVGGWKAVVEYVRQMVQTEDAPGGMQMDL